MKRLRAEAAFNAQSVLEHMVAERDVRVRVKLHDDGQAYIAIGATASYDESFFVALVSAIPGVPVDDWLPEPEGGLGIEPLPGEIIWSAMLSAEAQAQLLREHESG